jgi:hypothetical protein
MHHFTAGMSLLQPYTRAHFSEFIIIMQTLQLKLKITTAYFHDNIEFVEAETRRPPYNLYVWTALTAMILSLDGDGAVCELDCPTACPSTLWLSTWPFFGCFGAVYVRDVLPSCDDFPIPNNDASLELQHFDRNHIAANVCRSALQRMTGWKASFSHLEPGVKSSSSSPRNMLRYVQINDVTLQATCKPSITTTLPQLARPYPHPTPVSWWQFARITNLALWSPSTRILCDNNTR